MYGINMKSSQMYLWNLFVKHPVSLIFYFIYVRLFVLSLIRERAYYTIIRQNHGVWPCGVREDGLLIPLFGGIFFLISCANAIASKKNTFYLWLIVFIIVPLLAWTHLLEMMN